VIVRATSSACPICKKEARPRTENRNFPFCSDRCKTVDLGNWLNETYRVENDDIEDGGAGREPPREPS